MGSLERYPRPNLKILSTNERDETVRERVILNFFRNILEVTKTPPIHQSDLKKSQLHHLRGFARKNTAITGEICEKTKWRTFNYRVYR